MKAIPDSTLQGVCAILATHRPGLTPDELRDRLEAPTIGAKSSIPEHVSVVETARALHLGERTVWRMLKAGRLPKVTIGGVVRIPVSAVNALLASEATEQQSA